MKLEKALKRDKKINKKKNGMRISGASVKLLEQIKQEKAKKETENA